MNCLKIFEIDDERSYFKVTFFIHHEFEGEKKEDEGIISEPKDTLGKIAEKLPKKRWKTAEKILAFLNESSSISVKDVEQLCNVKERRARDILAELVNAGILKKIGKTKGTYYIKNIEKVKNK